MTTDPREIYPDVFDPNGDDVDADLKPTAEVASPANIARKRLYVAVSHLLTTRFNAQNLPKDPWDLATDSALGSQTRLQVLSVLGILRLRGYADPSLGRLERGRPGPNDIEVPDETGLDYGKEPVPNTDPVQWIDFRVLIVPEFVNAMTEAVKDFNLHRKLYKQAYLEIRRQAFGLAENGGMAPTPVVNQRTFDTKLLAQVGQRLVTDGVDPDSPLVVTSVRNAVATTVGGGGIGGNSATNPSAIDLTIPDLDAGTSVEILPDNLGAVRSIYFSAQLEEMKLHSVFEKIVEHYQSGMLPISRGSSADALHRWIKNAADRISEVERRALYGRTLGLAQGGTDVLPNREFSGLWVRFLSTVSQKYREISSLERDQVSVEQVHKSGRDLAVNLSLHGYGWASPAATEMIEVITEIFTVLDAQSILQSYGVRDRWQLVDRVSSLYLGGSANGVKYRSMAQTGQLIIEWLANSAPVLASGSANGLEIVEWVGDRRKPTAKFKELAEWCERWLAATGTPDAEARQNTDPVDLPTQHTVPMLGQNVGGMPQAVQDALDQVGGGVLPNLPVIPQA